MEIFGGFLYTFVISEESEHIFLENGELHVLVIIWKILGKIFWEIFIDFCTLILEFICKYLYSRIIGFSSVLMII